jgi:hypothetical protein
MQQFCCAMTTKQASDMNSGLIDAACRDLAQDRDVEIAHWLQEDIPDCGMGYIQSFEQAQDARDPLINWLDLV